MTLCVPKNFIYFGSYMENITENYPHLECCWAIGNYWEVLHFELKLKYFVCSLQYELCFVLKQIADLFWLMLSSTLAFYRKWMGMREMFVPHLHFLLKKQNHSIPNRYDNAQQ